MAILDYLRWAWMTNVPCNTFPHHIFQSINMVWWEHLGMSCWTDEDYIGRVARVARKTHGIQLPISTIQKCLIHYRSQWRKICASWDARLIPGCWVTVASLWCTKRLWLGQSRLTWGILDHPIGLYKVLWTYPIQIVQSFNHSSSFPQNVQFSSRTLISVLLRFQVYIYWNRSCMQV